VINDNYELTKKQTCDCNDNAHVYSTDASYRQHTKTMKHQLWETKQGKRNLEIQCTRLQNEVDNLKRLNNLLIMRLSNDLTKIYEKKNV